MAKLRVHNFSVSLDGFGASTIWQCIRAGLLDDTPENYECTERVCSPSVVHFVLTRR